VDSGWSAGLDFRELEEGEGKEMGTGYSRQALDLTRVYQELIGRKRERDRLELAAAQMRDAELAQARKNGGGKIGKDGRLVRQISVSAVMNAVDTEGREVMNAEEYWRDQDRRYFGIDESAPRSLRAMRNRHGRVSWRKVY
jgi:hypothetical protein